MTAAESAVVAVDIGSSSVRVSLRDKRGAAHPRAFAQVRYAMTVDDRGGVSIDVDRLIAIVGEALDAFVGRTPARAMAAVRGVGVSCFLHSIAALDEDRRPISPLLTWADTTSAGAAAELRARLDEGAVWQATGCPLHASYWPAKIVRLRALLGSRVRAFAGAPTLIHEALTGSFGIDRSEASGSGLLDRASGGWHDGLLEALGLDPSQLPALAPPFVANGLAGPSAERWPALAGVPWFVPWSDAWCGNVGLGQTAGRGAALQVGTSGAMRIVVDDGVPPVPPGLFAHSLADGTALIGGQLSEGGGVVAAIARLLGSTPSRLDVAATRLPPAGHGISVLPYLSGERGPGYHAGARGVLSGLTLGTEPAEVHLAVLEAIAYRIAAIDERLAGPGPRHEVAAAGGALSASALWPTIIAAALGRPIRLSSEAEASTRGAAILALAASGAIDDAAEIEPPPSTLVEPDPERTAAYGPAMARQAELYEHLLG